MSAELQEREDLQKMLVGAYANYLNLAPESSPYRSVKEKDCI
jgi:hypothetical protein